MHVYVRPNRKLSVKLRNMVWRTLNGAGQLPDNHKDPETCIQIGVEELPDVVDSICNNRKLRKWGSYPEHNGSE